MEATAAVRRIIRVLDVVDTREYEEQGDRFVPVVGSGSPRDCDRCGRLHEVHAHVELDDGSEAVVGTGCMRQDEADVASRVRSMARRASSLARLRRARAALVAKQEAWNAAWRMVAALPTPPVEYGTETMFDGREYPILRMGAEKVSCMFCGPSRDDWAERAECLEDIWRRARMRELGFDRRQGGLDDLDRRIARLERAQEDLG